MERYLGADVHAASTTFCVLDGSGKRIRRDVIETNGKALIGYLGQLAGDLHLCIEEGEWSQWLYEILAPRVTELVVYRGEWKPGQKSDAIDAHGLAEKLRTGKIDRPVFKDAKQFTALRDRARTYTMVTRDVARVKSRLKSFFRARGVPCTGESVFKSETRAERARALPPATREMVELLGRELTALEALKAEAEASMVKESHRHRVARILETAPGLGPIRVAQLLPIVVTPHSLSHQAAVLGLLRLRDRDAFVERLGARGRSVAEDARLPDARIELQPQPDGEGDLQGSRDVGDRALWSESAARGVRPSARDRDEAEPGQAHGGPADRRDRAGDVEDTGGVRPRQRLRARHTLIRLPTTDEPAKTNSDLRGTRSRGSLRANAWSRHRPQARSQGDAPSQD